MPAKLLTPTPNLAMNELRQFGTLSNSEETDRLGEVLCQCFNLPLNEWDKYRDRIGGENFRILRQGRAIVGGLGIYHMGQWWGGDRVSMAGIAAVGVLPEDRGTGAAVELLTHTLGELHRQGIALSTLYAATQRVYRKVGYEQAGEFCDWEVTLDSIQMRDRTLPLHRVESIHAEVFAPIYRQQALHYNGNLDRNFAIWQQILQPKGDEVVYADLVGNPNQPEGHIIFTQKNTAQGVKLVVLDWVALTPAAARRLWTFLGDARSQISTATWRGSSVDSLLLFLPEQTAKITHLERWFMRVVNVKIALEQRGYPVTLNAELHLEVRDTLLPENNGKFILTVSGGQGKVTPGGRGDLRLDPRGLSPLYSGLYRPYQLQLAGHLEGTPNAVSVATEIFAGSPPWMPDFF